MAPVIKSSTSITLQDFLGLTNGLPGETCLMAIVVDDDELSHSGHWHIFVVDSNAAMNLNADDGGHCTGENLENC